jgi:heme exporter protein D
MFLSLAYALTVVCMVYECVVLNLRRQTAIRRMRESVAEDARDTTNKNGEPTN